MIKIRKIVLITLGLLFLYHGFDLLMDESYVTDGHGRRRWFWEIIYNIFGQKGEAYINILGGLYAICLFFLKDDIEG